MATKYQDIYQRSIKDVTGFWSEVLLKMYFGTKNLQKF